MILSRCSLYNIDHLLLCSFINKLAIQNNVIATKVDKTQINVDRTEVVPGTPQLRGIIILGEEEYKYTQGTSKPIPSFLFPVMRHAILPPRFKKNQDTFDNERGTCPTM